MVKTFASLKFVLVMCVQHMSPYYLAVSAAMVPTTFLLFFHLFNKKGICYIAQPVDFPLYTYCEMSICI